MFRFPVQNRTTIGIAEPTVSVACRLGATQFTSQHGGGSAGVRVAILTDLDITVGDRRLMASPPVDADGRGIRLEDRDAMYCDCEVVRVGTDADGRIWGGLTGGGGQPRVAMLGGRCFRATDSKLGRTWAGRSCRPRGGGCRCCVYPAPCGGHDAGGDDTVTCSGAYASKRLSAGCGTLALRPRGCRTRSGKGGGATARD